MSLSEMMRYLQITIGVSILLIGPILILRKLYLKKKRITYSWKYELTDICFIFYMLCLFQITAFRFGGIGWDLDNMLSRMTRVNSIPFVVLWRWVIYGTWWHLFYNVIGNCLWFIPFGFLLPALYSDYRQYGWLVIFMGMIVSMIIEILQFILCTGVTDIDDVIFNTLGTAIGYLLWYIVDSIRKSFKKKGKKC